MFSDLFNIAIRNVKRRGIRSWLTMIGIFIGISAVVSLISLGSSLQTAITGQFSSIDPDKLTISNAETGFGPPGSTAIKKLNKNDLELVEKINGVDLTIKRYIRVAEVEYNKISNFRYVVNVPEEKNKKELVYDTLNVKPQIGKLLGENDAGKILLGSDYLGDRYEKEINVGKKLKIQDKSFEVVGILEEASTFTINSAIFMLEKDLEDLLEIEDEIDIIVVQVEDSKQVSKVKKSIEDALRKDRNLEIGEEDFSVQTPQQAISDINQILVILNIIVSSIAGVSLFVGGVGITNTMYTSVLERRKEIGIMKAVGARNKDILTLFLIESSMLGLIGGIAGALIGLGFAFLFSIIIANFLPGINFVINFSMPLITLSILFDLFVGTISGSFPENQASKLKPVEALRS
ncbi:hypothetical protein CXT76_01165 [Candidatus Parvarchaeota archaeon]|nr:MAG: hypothetical protein CXT76_01165 [Candidatus Parvarchaeota archaeon]